MATWSTILSYLRNNYKIAEEFTGDDGSITGVRLIFDVGDLRSQFVYVWHHSLRDGEESWAQISSPFAGVDRVDLLQVLQHAGNLVCGGLSCVGETLVLSHSVPLQNLDLNEFERPFQLVLHTADRLEQEFGGGDDF